MSRDDMHLDSMLRHLGAAYYDSLHGRAAKSDVTRAVDQVAQQLGEKLETHAPAPRPALHQAHHRVPRHHGRLHSRIRDVMTTEVVTVDRITPFKEIAELLVEHKISGLPVIRLGRHLVGVVTEGDLIKARDRRAAKRRNWTGMLRYDTDRARYLRLTAEQLMTSPAISIHPDASIAAAARLMSSHNIKRLPVVDSDGTLVGLVSRRDLLNVFCIPDSDIARQVREVLAEVVLGESAPIKAAVHGGIVTVTGHTETAAERNSIAKAIDFAWDLDGVVDLIDHVTSPELDLT
jgi:CBS domain-containing protein